MKAPQEIAGKHTTAALEDGEKAHTQLQNPKIENTYTTTQTMKPTEKTHTLTRTEKRKAIKDTRTSKKKIDPWRGKEAFLAKLEKHLREGGSLVDFTEFERKPRPVTWNSLRGNIERLKANFTPRTIGFVIGRRFRHYGTLLRIEYTGMRVRFDPPVQVQQVPGKFFAVFASQTGEERWLIPDMQLRDLLASEVQMFQEMVDSFPSERIEIAIGHDRKN